MHRYLHLLVSLISLSRGARSVRTRRSLAGIPRLALGVFSSALLAPVLPAQTTFSTNTTLTTNGQSLGTVTIDPNVTVTGSDGVTVSAGNSTLNGTLALPTGSAFNLTGNSALTVTSTGQILLQGGVLEGTNFKLEAADGIIASGGTIRASGNSSSFVWAETLFSGNVQLAPGGLTLDANGYDVTTFMYYGGAGDLTISGGGRLAFAGLGAYSGSTTIGSGTTVELGKAQAFRISSNVHLASGATLDASKIGNYSGGFAVTDKATVSGLSGSGTVSIGTTNFLVGYADASSTFSGNITGSGNLYKTGTGTFTIDGENTYTGSSNFEGGTTVIAAGGSLTHAGASLFVGKTGGGASSLNIDGGAVTSATGAIGYFGGYTGTVNLSAGTWNSTSLDLGYVGNGTLTLTGGTATTGVTRLGYLGGTGTLNLNGGVLATSGVERWSSPSSFSAAGGTLRATTNNANILNGIGTAPLGTGGLTVDSNGYAVGIATAFSGSGGLTKTGDGTLTLTGTQTYTGTTTVNGGTLLLGAADVLPTTNAVVVNDGGTLNLDHRNLTVGSLAGTGSGTVALGSGTLTTGGDNSSTAFAGALTGTGGLTKTGNGTFTLSGTNTYTGNTAVNGGALSVATGGSLTSPAATVAVGTASTASLIIDGSSVTADTLTLGFNAGVGTLTVANSGILSTANLQRWSGGSTVTFDGGTVQALGDAPQLLNGFTLSSAVINAGGLTVDTNGHDVGFSANTVLSGTGGLTKTGTGTLTLGTTQAYDGATTINAGTLLLASPTALPSATAVTVASGATLNSDNQALSLGALSGAGTVNTGTSALTVGSGNTSSTFAGNLTSTGGLNKTGTGTFTVSGANTYSGDTYVNAGTLQLATGGSIQHASHSVVIANTGTAGVTLAGGNLTASSVVLGHDGGTATLTLNAGTLTTSEIARWSIPSSVVFNGGTLRAAGNTTVLLNGFDAGSAIINSGGLTLDTNGFAVATSSILSGTGGLTKTGTGTLTLNTPHTYTGATSVRGGTLTLDPNGSLSTPSAILSVGAGSSTTLRISGGAATSYDAQIGQLSGNTGQVEVTSGNWTVSRLVDLGYQGTGTLTTSGGTSTVGAIRLGVQGGTGTIALNGGTLSTNQILRYTEASAISFDGGTLQARSDQSGLLVGFSAGSATINSGGLTLDTQNHAVGVPAEFTGTGGLTKTGAGSLTLSGTSTYTGATTVNAGSLVVDGSLATSALTVNSGATLSGSGTIGSLALASGAILSPGNSPGTLSTGSQTWAGGASYVWEINDAANPSTGAGTRYDLLAISGTLTINATAENKFTLSLVSLLANHSAGDVINFNAAQNSAYTIATTTGGILGFDANAFTINATGFTNALNGGTWSLALANANKDLALNFTAAAIPEPSTYAALFGAGALALALYRRRQQRA